MYEHDDELLARVREYIAQNRMIYSVEALRARLIKDGVPPEVVDRVLIEPPQSPYLGPSPAAAPETSRRWSPGKIVGIVAGTVVLNLLLGAGIVSLVVWTELPWFGILAPVVVGAEIAYAVVYSKRNPSVTVGLVLAVVLTPVAVVILLLGACLLLIASMNGNMH